MFNKRQNEGVLVPIWGTLTAAEKIKDLESKPFLRRLFALVLADSSLRAKRIANKLRTNVNSFSESYL